MSFSMTYLVTWTRKYLSQHQEPNGSPSLTP
jgi:hypothetical protein